MMQLLKKLDGYISPILTIISIITMLFTIDAYYAKASAVDKLEMRLEQKILQDRQDRVQERIWTMEDRWVKKEKMPKETLEHLRQLQLEKYQINMKLNAIEMKVNKK